MGATDNHDGTWSVDPNHLNNVYLQAPSNWSGNTNFTVSATSKEGLNGPSITSSTVVHAHIDGVSDTPLLSVHDVTGTSNHAIGLNISAALTDIDGSENLSVVISNVPDDFIFSSGLNNGDGSWSFNQTEIDHLEVIAKQNFTGDVNMHVDVFATDDHHIAATAQADFVVHVNPDP